jgi:hypothetical protein
MRGGGVRGILHTFLADCLFCANFFCKYVYVVFYGGTGWAHMLRKEIGEYYRLAAEARERASAHADPIIRQEFLEMEQRWLLLAHRHTISKRLRAYTGAKPPGGKRG